MAHQDTNLSNPSNARTGRLGKAIAAGTVVASSAIAGVQATVPVPVDHAAVSLASTVRTLRGVIPWPIDATLSGAVCGPTTGNTCDNFEYAVLFGDMGIGWAADSLNEALQDTARPTTIFGYSEGAAVASKWLVDHSEDSDAPSPDDLHFIMTGNPQRKYGGSRSVYPFTPVTPNTAYSVLDIAREYDGVADVPDDWWNIIAQMNASWGYLFIHTAYTNVDLTTDEKLVWQEGNTTYVLLRTPDLPILMPLRLMGLGFLADALTAPFKAIIDSAYHRNYPGIITDPVKAQKAVDDALKGKSSDEPEPEHPTSLAVAAAATAASLVTTQDTDPTPEPTHDDVDRTRPVETEAPKVVATEENSPEATADIEAEVAADSEATPDADPDPGKAEADDDAEPAGRHRAPEVSDATEAPEAPEVADAAAAGASETSDTAPSTQAKDPAATDPAPKHAAPDTDNASA